MYCISTNHLESNHSHHFLLTCFGPSYNPLTYITEKPPSYLVSLSWHSPPPICTTLTPPTAPRQPILKAVARVALLMYKSNHVTLLLKLFQHFSTHSEKPKFL